MQNNRDEYEPIIATRRSREPIREDTQPLWRLVLALGGGVAAVGLLVWWFMGRSSNDGTPAVAQTEISEPEIRIEPETFPPAAEIEPDDDKTQPSEPVTQDAEPAHSAEQAATPESIPEVVPDTATQSPTPPATVSVQLMSPDTHVQFELRGPLDSSPPLLTKAGDVVDLAPGTYRVVASGAQLESFEQEITLVGDRPAEYTVELCAQPKQEIKTLVGQVVEERACASSAECESMFMVMSEHAEQLVKDSAFRKQQCAKWRADAAPDGRWTLDSKCDGATLATTCRIEIAEGACALAEPRRSVRGEACPRSELK